MPSRPGGVFIAPENLRSSPATMRSRLDLPQPDGPTQRDDGAVLDAQRKMIENHALAAAGQRKSLAQNVDFKRHAAATNWPCAQAGAG